MSKRNHKKHEMNHKMSKNAGKHTCGGSYPRLPIFPGLFPGMTLKVKKIHFHLDEHMESKNFYHNGSCCCDDEDSVVVDLDEMAQKIAEQTGIRKGTIRKVLAAEDEYLAELGICEIVDVEEAPDEEDSAEEESLVGKQHDEKQDEPAESEVGNDEQ